MKKSILPWDLARTIVQEKHKQVEMLLAEYQIPCWLVFTRETEVIMDPVLPYISEGVVVWESAFVFSLKSNQFKKVAFVGNFDVDAFLGTGLWDKVIGYTQGIAASLRAYFDELNPEVIALNYSSSDVSADGLSHGLFLRLREILPDFNSKFISAEHIIADLRGVKSKTEQRLIKEAVQLTESINQYITSTLRVGLSEIEIQNMFHNYMDKLEVKESWQRKSCPAIDAGPEKNFGHVGPTSLKTRKHHSLHNDFGIKLKGYSSDIQRMWYFGSPESVSPELRHAFDTVKEAIRLAAKNIKPGMKGYEVDSIAREYVVAQGYDEFSHALGHQVGRATHDGGTLLAPMWERYGASPSGIVKEGQVFTLELHVSTKNYGMVSLEEMIVVTATGCEFIIPPVEDFIYIY